MQNKKLGRKHEKGFLKYDEFLYWLKDCWVLNKDSEEINF
jgi:hypothetical protein